MYYVIILCLKKKINRLHRKIINNIINYCNVEKIYKVTILRLKPLKIKKNTIYNFKKKTIVKTINQNSLDHTYVTGF